MNLAALERQMAHRADLDAIPTMSREERASKLSAYKSEVDRLADEEEQALAAMRQFGPDNVNISVVQALRKVARLHHSAQKSLERVEKAVAKAEETEHQAIVIPANTDYVARPGQSSSKGKRRKQS